MPHVKAGKLKPIAVMGAARDPSARSIPAAELFPDFDFASNLWESSCRVIVVEWVFENASVGLTSPLR